MKSSDQRKIEYATEAFRRCPCCGDENLFTVDCEVICFACDWNSIQWSVSQGHMDKLYHAADMAKKLNTSTKIISVDEHVLFNLKGA